MKGFPFNFPFIILRSVGCVIVPSSGYTYPLLADDSCEFDEGESVPCWDCSEEWWNSLSGEDVEIVNTIYNEVGGYEYGNDIDPAGGYGLHSHV